MMKTILWYQGNFDSQKGMMIVDGEKKTYGESPLHDAAFDKLLSARKWSKQININTSLLICFNSSTKEVYIQSNFDDRDEKGRRKAFMFYLKEFQSAEEVCKELAKNASIAHNTVNESEMEIIRKKASLLLKGNTSYYLIAAGIISLILIITYICRSCQGK